MENIKEYLKNNILVADGGMGTYVASIAGRRSACERMNLSDPDIILNVHRQYIGSGARMITTNTFGANPSALGKSREQTREILLRGVDIARRAAEEAGEHIYIAGDIGPVPAEQENEKAREEYRLLVDTFFEAGVDIFLFETFASARFPVELSGYIKARRPDTFILADFAVQPDGYSRFNIPGARLIEQAAACGNIDAAGFNCVSGPSHLLRYASKIAYGGLFPVLMPNAGYPQKTGGKYIFSGSPRYFADTVAKAAGCGFKILGGCCGTTPEHIRYLAAAVKKAVARPSDATPPSIAPKRAAMPENPLFKASRNGKIIMAELDPPFDADISKTDASAVFLSRCGVDAITVPDSPMARARADSVFVAARINRVAGIQVIPHLACRDRNLNSIKSSMLAAHIGGIRNILAITGDPIPEIDKGIVKGVFNFNSAGLCGFLRDMNADIFHADPVFCGCAFNVNSANIDEELKKLDRKIASGASFIMTQPVFTAQSAEALKRLRGSGLKVIAGILTPVSYRNAVFLANELPGVTVPPEVIEAFSPEMTREEGERAGIEISAATAERIADYCDGYYLISPFNRVSVAGELLRRLREKKILSPVG